jgi:RHH-type proline utilization regulon transcriptional repressor/proline dehydrogenase/delta 1-pyrroline-5-carboxylate dehydrogenase
MRAADALNDAGRAAAGAIAARVAALARVQFASRALPGPTGESNELRLHSRGVVGALASTADEAVEQWCASLAGGNPVIAAVAGGLRTEALALLQILAGAGLAREDLQLLDAPLDAAAAAMSAHEDIAAVCATPALALAVRRALALRSGAIVPLLSGPASGELYRLVAEQTLTINTAAAGGNAALLAGLPLH